MPRKRRASKEDNPGVAILLRQYNAAVKMVAGLEPIDAAKSDRWSQNMLRYWRGQVDSLRGALEALGYADFRPSGNGTGERPQGGAS